MASNLVKNLFVHFPAGSGSRTAVIPVARECRVLSVRGAVSAAPGTNKSVTVSASKNGESDVDIATGNLPAADGQAAMTISATEANWSKVVKPDGFYLKVVVNTSNSVAVGVDIELDEALIGGTSRLL